MIDDEGLKHEQEAFKHEKIEHFIALSKNSLYKEIKVIALEFLNSIPAQRFSKVYENWVKYENKVDKLDEFFLFYQNLAIAPSNAQLHEIMEQDLADVFPKNGYAKRVILLKNLVKNLKVPEDAFKVEKMKYFVDLKASTSPFWEFIDAAHDLFAWIPVAQFESAFAVWESYASEAELEHLKLFFRRYEEPSSDPLFGTERLFQNMLKDLFALGNKLLPLTRGEQLNYKKSLVEEIRKIATHDVKYSQIINQTVEFINGTSGSFLYDHQEKWNKYKISPLKLHDFFAPYETVPSNERDHDFYSFMEQDFKEHLGVSSLKGRTTLLSQWKEQRHKGAEYSFRFVMLCKFDEYAKATPPAFKFADIANIFFSSIDEHVFREACEIWEKRKTHFEALGDFFEHRRIEISTAKNDKALFARLMQEFRNFHHQFA